MMHLPPYQERPDESLLQKCERLRRELQAAAKPRYANDNAPEYAPEPREPMWWQRD